MHDPLDLLLQHAHSILGLSRRMQVLTWDPLPQPLEVRDRYCRPLGKSVLSSSRFFALCLVCSGQLPDPAGWPVGRDRHVTGKCWSFSARQPLLLSCERFPTIFPSSHAG